jgi:hypothetical protein
MTESVKLIMMIPEIHYICDFPVSVWRDDRDEYEGQYYEISVEVSITRCMSLA